METRNIPGGTLKITLANASQYLIMGLFYIVVAKTNALTQEDIGILSILTFIATTFSLLTILELPTALTKFASERLAKNQQKEAAEVQRTITNTVIMLSVAGLAVAVLSSQLLSQYLWRGPEYSTLVIMAVSYAFLTNIIALCNSDLQVLYLFGKMAVISFVSVLSSRVIGVILALFNFGVVGVMIGYLIGLFIALIIAIKSLRGRLPKSIKKMPLKPFLRFSLPLFFTSLTLLIINWADVIIITSVSGNYSITGVYYIVVNSVGALSILWIPMKTTLFPAFSAHYGLKDSESISAIIRTASRYLVYLVFPCCVGLAIIAPTALTFFYGAGYSKGAIPLAILSINSIVIAIYILFTTTLTAIGKTRQILKINSVFALSTVLLLMAFVPFLESIGAALARFVAQIISLALATYELRKEVEIQLDKEALWKSALASASTIPFLLAIELIMSVRVSTTQTLIIEVFTAAGIYLFALYALKALRKQDFKLLRQAFPKPLEKYLNILEGIIVR